MNQRLVWNFELSNKKPIQLAFSPFEKIIKWERRFFFLGSDIIILNGLSSEFLNLAHYQIKEKEDNYLIHPSYSFNIKFRDGNLWYKPLLEQYEDLQGYGKKIPLENISIEPLFSPLNSQKETDIVNRIKSEGQTVLVKKIALSYKFPKELGLKFELSKLEILNQIYFSVCVEGYCKFHVLKFSNLLLSNQISCDYVSFLKNIYKKC